MGLSEDEIEFLQDRIEELENDHPNVRFDRLKTICRKVFGEGRTRGSHHIFSTPWPGDPRINLQESSGGEAKPYQIKQVIKSLKKRLEMGKE